MKPRLRRIAILLHERHRDALSWPYRIWAMARLWERWGITVEPVWGVDRPIQADLLIPHIDLSYVPDEYWQVMQEFPGPVVNRRVRDIRKRAFSTLLVKPGDGYAGPVIVKTDANNGGRSERKILGGPEPRTALGRFLMRRQRSPSRERASLGEATSLRRYHVFERADDVPIAVYENQALVVEQYVPERRNGQFLLHHYEFFGDYEQVRTHASADPMVKTRTAKIEMAAGVPEVLREQRARLGLDYAKLDYVVQNGGAHLLDISTSIGMGREIDETLVHLSRGLAGGLSFFERVHGRE